MKVFSRWKNLKETFDITRDNIIIIVMTEEDYQIVVKLYENRYLDINLFKDGSYHLVELADIS